MNSCLLIFLVLLVPYNCQLTTDVVYQCADTLYGPLCLYITNKDCFELTATISMDGQSIYGPTSVPIANILREIQNQKNQNNTSNLICYTLTGSTNFGTCSLCATIDQFKVEGNSIHYCGTGTFNCSSLLVPTISQSFDIPCIEMKNCGLFGCGTTSTCNYNGYCNSYGMCECYGGYYGFDCSIQATYNCISAPNIDNSCWIGTWGPNCDTISIAVSNNVVGGETVTEYPLDGFTSFPIVPCKTVINNPSLQCDMCFTFEDIHSDNINLVGCTTLSMNCNGIPAGTDTLSCGKDVVSSPNRCIPSPKQQPFYTNPIFYGLGIVLVILVVLSVGFLVVKKFGGFKNAKPEVYVEEEEQLNESDY